MVCLKFLFPLDTNSFSLVQNFYASDLTNACSHAYGCSRILPLVNSKHTAEEKTALKSHDTTVVV